MFSDRRIKAAFISIAVDVTLVSIKLWGASVSQSRGLRADALHSFSDICVSSLVLISILGARQFQKWGRAFEEGTAFLIGIIITWVAVGVLRSSNSTVSEGSLGQVPLAIVLTWACILIAYFASQYKLRVGRECDAANLRADGHQV
jgi:membrane protease subunit HflK